MAEKDTPATPGDRYQALFEKSGDALLVMHDNHFVDCNEAAVELLGYQTRDAVLQCEPWQISPEFQPDGVASQEKQRQHLETVLEKGTHRFEWEHLKADGSVFPVEVVLTVLYVDEGMYLNVRLHDLTERRQLERELRHAQKMDAIGKLVGGVAHDFNNQLVPILGYAELLKKRLSDEPELRELVENIEIAGNRSAELIRRLMALSYKQDVEDSFTDINASVSELTGLLRQLIGEDIVLQFEPADQPLTARIGASDIEHIVLNLASNARDAMPGGGVIQLSVSRQEYAGRPCARLRIEDEGLGMDEESLANIFEPFFTTKMVGSGTGLGLASVYNLVTRASGHINVSSTLGQGSVFEVWLPLASPGDGDSVGVPTSKAVRPARATPDSNCRVLLVEDDDDTAGLMQRALRDADMHVVRVSNGRNALELLSRESFDLLVTDIIMPGMSGPQLVRETEARGHALPVVFVSGYTDDRLASQGFDPAAIALLRKPFTPSQLLEEVRRKLTHDCQSAHP